MAAIVLHGLQPCLDSHLVESITHALRLPSPKPLTPQPIDLASKSCFRESNTKPHCEENSYKTHDTVHHNPNTNTNTNQGGGSWSSIQALSNVPQGPKEPTYVHPQVKLSWQRLSPKSLELCTENLGNETGTDITESGIDLLSSTNCAGGNLETTKEETKSCQVLGAKKEKAKNFPPPLTTMRGSESLRVKPHREGGRLVIEVTKVPPSAPSFQAERSHGRLRLRLWTDPEDDDDSHQGYEQELQDVENEEEQEEEGVEEGFDIENEGGGGGGEKGTCGGCEESKGNNSYWRSGMRMEKYEMLSRRRCKEGDHENSELLLNWGEPLCVATS